MGNLLQELKRRNVFKVGIAYLALGWVIIQVTQAAVPALGMPNYVNTVVFFFGLIGFPFAIFFTWAFEMTPDGVKHTSGIEETYSITHQAGQKINLVIIALLVFGLGYFAWKSRLSEVDTAGQEQGTTLISVAVLPFVNMSSDPEQEYFSDGISEEILNMLAQIPNLHVTSRSSAFAFKGKTTDIPTIANQLGVANVLEGSVRKSGNRIRITAQLIEAATDKHLWSETFDRELSDIFAIQDEISIAISNALKIKLMGQMITRKVPTKNLEAYNLYLKGHELFLYREGAKTHQAIKLYEEALALDPTFAEAWAGLGACYAILPYYDFSFNHESLGPESDRVLSKALGLDPDLAIAWAVKGFAHNGKLEWRESEITLRHALKLNPNNETALIWMGFHYVSTGHFERAIPLYQKALSLAPLTFFYRGLLGRAMFLQGDVEGGKIHLDYARSRGWAGAEMDAASIAMFEGRHLDATKNMSEFAYTYGELTDEKLGVYFQVFNKPSLRDEAEKNLEIDRNSNRPLQHLLGSLYLKNGENFAYNLENKSNIVGYHVPMLYIKEFRPMMKQQTVKDYLTRVGLVDYWRSSGWPSFCHPLGEDDFECGGK